MAGTFSLLIIPTLWILFRNETSLIYAFGLPILSNLAIYIICAYTLHHYIQEFKPICHLLNAIVIYILASFVAFITIILLQEIFEESLYRTLISTGVSSIIILVLSYFFAPRTIKKNIRMWIKQKIYTSKNK